jgi:hypothetical protein
LTAGEPSLSWASPIRRLPAWVEPGRTVRAVSIIIVDEPYLLDPEEAASLAWLLRNLEAPESPDVETAAMTAAVIVEDAARGVRAGTRMLTDEEERAALTVLEQAARTAGLSPRLSRLHGALQRAHG